MLTLIFRRLDPTLATIFIILLIIFFGVEALPGAAATAYLGQLATPESLKALRAEFGLDQSPVERYAVWLGGALRGDFGDSMSKKKPVTGLIGNRFRNTVVLSIAASLLPSRWRLYWG